MGTTNFHFLLDYLQGIKESHHIENISSVQCDLSGIRIDCQGINTANLLAEVLSKKLVTPSITISISGKIYYQSCSNFRNPSRLNQ